MSQFVGIDISKESFDVYFEDDGKGNYVKLSQTVDGYKILISLIGRNRICVMESTGNYHVRLASYLFEEGVKTVVENPLKIKRYSQMRLQRTKTDKADSHMIFDYGETILAREEYHIWKPDSKHIGDLKQYDTVRQQLVKQQTALSNTEEAMLALSDLNKDVNKVLKEVVKAVDKALKTLDKGMLELVKKHHEGTFKLITSIPGVGTKTATMMICLTDGFQKFQHNEVKQFISYIGMSPRTFNSGTSVKGRAHITKVGNGRIRSLLYMCSWTAKRCNQQCTDLYERLAEKGKPEMVIKVAIAHKIVRQIFGVVKSGQPFSNEFA